jgi:hypothetical protein
VHCASCHLLQLALLVPPQPLPLQALQKRVLQLQLRLL